VQIGLVSDLHGNRPALEAVIEDMPTVDRLVCAGDVVGYNPWPAACVEWIREEGIPTVMGNHDRAVATGSAFRFNAIASAGVEYAREQLNDDQLDWLAALPTERVLFDGRVRVVHGHPEDPDRYTRPREFSPNLLTAGDPECVDGVSDPVSPDVLVLGHTHVQHHAVFEEGVVCNPGSVGQPRDGDPLAAYAIVDLDERSVEERRVEYDIEAVQAAVEDTGLPERIATRLFEGR
jgi:predicted phosphodiesterase